MNTSAILALLGNLYEQLVATQEANAALQAELEKERNAKSAPDIEG